MGERESTRKRKQGEESRRDIRKGRTNRGRGRE